MWVSFGFGSADIGLGGTLAFFERGSKLFEQGGDSMNCSFGNTASVFTRHLVVSLFTEVDASINSSSSESVWVKAATNVLFDDSAGD